MYIASALGGAAATSLVGSLLGGFSSSNGTTQDQSTTKEPWGPAQDWIKQNIGTGQQLQNYYQQNPFNPQQQAGMQNTLTDADHFRNNVLPGLLNFANGAMGGQYTRQKGGAPGSGAGYGGSVKPGGYTAGMGSTFSAAPGQNFGQIDWSALNPLSAQNTSK